jgi:hypothetical protein
MRGSKTRRWRPASNQAHPTPQPPSTRQAPGVVDPPATPGRYRGQTNVDDRRTSTPGRGRPRPGFSFLLGVATILELFPPPPSGFCTDDSEAIRSDWDTVLDELDLLGRWPEVYRCPLNAPL